MARFAVTHRCGAARCGMLVGVPTPMVLPQSRLCQVPYLPQGERDVCSSERTRARVARNALQLRQCHA